MTGPPDRASIHHSDPFGSTRWSVVLQAGGSGHDAHEALETLFTIYWLPVYGYVRSRTKNVEDAHDLTQGFFADLLDRNAVAAADPERGRFRAFLLTSLKHFLVNQHVRDRAKKRGGDHVIVSLDLENAERRLSVWHASGRTPEQEYQRRWALALLDLVIEKLAEEQIRSGREREFESLRPCLTGQTDGASLRDVARALGATPDAVRASIYRLRKRYRKLLREEVAQTVNSIEELDDELHALIAAVRGFE